MKTKIENIPDAGSIEKWLDDDEVRKRLRISNSTLKRWRSKNLIRFSRIGRKTYYSEQDLVAFLQQHKSK